MDEYMKKYCEQMDKVTLSDAADQAVLDDLLKADSRKGVSYMKWTKRNISAAMIVAIISIASVTVFAGVRTIIISNKTESQVEGVGFKVNVGKSSYFDLLAGDTGELYTLTDNDYDSALTGYPVIVWKSTDQGNTWQEILTQPNGLDEDSSVADDLQMREPSPIAGDLRMGENGIEAVVIVGGMHDDEQYNRVYQITEDSFVEYDMDEIYTLIGGVTNLFNIKYVNDHIIALVGVDKCVLYDINTQKVVKELPYDLTMGCLKTQDQFLLYGTEIHSCINAETLEEQTPEEGLQEFVQTMFEKNFKLVMPPMATWKDTIVCVTKSGIFEYKDGKTTQVRQPSRAINDGRPFNGLLPICKAGDDKYYISVFNFGSDGMSLWQIDGDKEEMK